MADPSVAEATDQTLIDALKALSNPHRLRILQWLKDPRHNFPPQDGGDPEDVGVCVKHIRAKAGVSQSTTSQFLAVLQRAGLVTSRRIGNWTYYKRDEDRIAELARRMTHEL